MIRRECIEVYLAIKLILYYVVMLADPPIFVVLDMALIRSTTTVMKVGWSGNS